MWADALDWRQSDRLRAVKEKLARAALALVELERLDRLAEELSDRFAAHFISHIVGIHVDHLARVAFFRYRLRYSKLGMCSSDNHLHIYNTLSPETCPCDRPEKSPANRQTWHEGKLLILCRPTPGQIVSIRKLVPKAAFLCQRGIASFRLGRPLMLEAASPET